MGLDLNLDGYTAGLKSLIVGKTAAGGAGKDVVQGAVPIETDLVVNRDFSDPSENSDSQWAQRLEAGPCISGSMDWSSSRGSGSRVSVINWWSHQGRQSLELDSE